MARKVALNAEALTQPRTGTAINRACQALTADHIPDRKFEPAVFTIEEFPAWARISRTQTFAEIKAGRLRAVKVGKRTLIPMEAAQAWLADLSAWKPWYPKAANASSKTESRVA